MSLTKEDLQAISDLIDIKLKAQTKEMDDNKVPVSSSNKYYYDYY